VKALRLGAAMSPNTIDEVRLILRRHPVAEQRIGERANKDKFLLIYGDVPHISPTTT
jgi:hypothetical protein